MRQGDTEEVFEEENPIPCWTEEEGSPDEWIL